MNAFTRLFPLWVSLCAGLALYHPSWFTWFSGPWITYGLGGIMLGMGLTLRWEDFAQVATRPQWVATGLLLQFTVMPLLGWGLSRLFQLPSFFAVGLILVSCCPGGTASNVMAYLARANVALSVAMTTCSTLGAILLTPLLTTTLSGSYLEVDGWGLLYSTLKVVLAPIVLGVLMNRYLPKQHIKSFLIRPRGGFVDCLDCGQYHWARKGNHSRCRVELAFGNHDVTFIGLYIGVFFESVFCQRSSSK